MKIKSSKCADSSCVVVDIQDNTVYVTDEHGNMCVYTSNEWKDFIAGVKLGEFDLK